MEFGFESLRADYKLGSLLKCRRLYIPIYYPTYCLLVIWDNFKVCLLDPYETVDTKQHSQTYQKQIKLLSSLKKLYFKEIYRINKMNIPNNEMTILRPPDIPKLNHPEDYGVLLLLFIKFDIKVG